MLTCYLNVTSIDKEKGFFSIHKQAACGELKVGVIEKIQGVIDKAEVEPYFNEFFL